jgi:hypothetical protein
MCLMGTCLLEFRSSERRRQGIALTSYTHLTPKRCEDLQCGSLIREFDYVNDASIAGPTIWI